MVRLHFGSCFLCTTWHEDLLVAILVKRAWYFHISYLLAPISSLLDVLSDQCLLVIFNPLSCMIRKESLSGFDVQALGFRLTSTV